MSDDKPRTTRHGTIIPQEDDEQQDEQFEFGNNQHRRNQPRYDANDPRGFRTHANPFYGERDIMDNFEYNEDEKLASLGQLLLGPIAQYNGAS